MNKSKLSNELSKNFIDYAASVNSDRAIPNAVDGMKPVAKRIIYGAFVGGRSSSKPHVKCARIVGDVMGSLHPHGDSSIYGALVRLAQDWVMRYPLIDFHGNVGNISGDGPAASRYTEARLSTIAEDGMLVGIKKNNVDFIPNYDETMDEPVSLPSIFPNLLCNPNSGIGVAMACNWAPHNLNEVAAAIIDYMDGKEPMLPGPDFPTGGLIINKNDIPNIMKTGKGTVKIRARYKTEDNKIIFYEVPYGETIENLVQQIGAACEDGDITKVTDVHDETNKKGVRIVVTCEKKAALDVIAEQIYAKTNMQTSFSYNQVALVDKTPIELNLKDCIRIYIRYNTECLIKECNFDLEKATARKEVVEGLLKAIVNIDDIISIIKKSEDKASAKVTLIEKYSFTDPQVEAILNMRLSSLTKLDGVKLNEEKAELEKKIKELTNILNSKDGQAKIIKNRLLTLVKKYGDKRRTELTQLNLTEEEKAAVKIVPQDVVVILTQDGNIKRIPKTSFRVQHRNTKGIKTLDKTVISTISTNTLDTLLIFTSKGLMHRIKVNDIPEGTNSTGGQSITLMSKIAPDEEIQAITSMNQNTNMKYVVFFTKNGLVKKTCMEEYTQMKKSTGIQAIKFKSEDDKLVNVEFMNDEDIILITKNGIGIRFISTDIAAIGRVTCGVKGINLKEDEVIAGIPVNKDSTCKIAIFSKQGYGKLLKINEFSTQGRGGRGVFVFKPDQKSGDIVAAALMGGDEDTLLISGKPNSVVIAAKEISTQGKAASGVKIIEKSQIERVIKL